VENVVINLVNIMVINNKNIIENMVLFEFFFFFTNIKYVLIYYNNNYKENVVIMNI